VFKGHPLDGSCQFLSKLHIRASCYHARGPNNCQTLPN
jgi:hypothetical protein